MKKTAGKPQPFGAVIEGNHINFSVHVPKGTKCSLLLYKQGKKAPEHIIDMPEEEGVGEVRFLGIEGIDPQMFEYNYQIGDKICVDPYVREITGEKEFGMTPEISEHEVRGKLVCTEYDWKGDRRLHLPWNEVIAYSLHVRGFTKHRSSGVRHKGTFRGVMEKLPYLKELGINQLQIMPVYEFVENDKGKVNYWGYGPAYFFAPKASYASGQSAVQELKELVRTCHAEGMEVVLEMPFVQGISAYSALECLRFYMLEYHIDGFIVNPYTVSWELLSSDPILKDIKLMRKDDAFQNVMRRFLKGDENMVNDVVWALRHHSASDGKCNYITTHTGFTLWDLVSYDSKHNEANGENNTDGPDYNYSWNCGAEGPSRRRIVSDLRKNQVRNAFFLLLTAQGTPCILAGDECYNSQRGNNNVYCQDNEIGWVDWTKRKTDSTLFHYVKELIRFRKTHPCLRREGELKGLDQTACGMPDVSYHGENAWQIKNEVSSRQLGVLYSSAGAGGNDCFIAYNTHWLPHSYALPFPGKGKVWKAAVSSVREEGKQPVFSEDHKQMELYERSFVLLESVADEKREHGPSLRHTRGKTGKEGAKKERKDG